jgi:hypothetical protein
MENFVKNTGFSVHMLAMPINSSSNLQLYHRINRIALKMKFLTEINRGN